MKKGLLIGLVAGTGVLTLGAIVLAIVLISGAKTKAVTHTKEISESFSSIKIDVRTSDVEFKLASDNKKKVVLDENNKDFHKVEVKDNTLNVKFVSTRQWFEKISFYNNLKVTVYLPDVNYENLNIESSTGDISVSSFKFASSTISVSTGDVSFNKVSVINAAKFSSSTGDFSLKELSCKNLEVSVSTGKIGVDSVNVSETAKFVSSTGSMNLKKLNAQNIDVKASTGNISFNNSIAKKNIKVETSTGDVEFIDSDAETLNIKTNTGNVKGSLLTKKIVYFKTSTGKGTYPHSTEGGLCEVETSTGNLNISFKN